ncbi:MAG: S8 family peptidase [Blastocatellia bacterium]
MARNLEHLELPQWQQALPKRKQGGGKTTARDDRKAHGQTLLAQAEQLANRLQARKKAAPQGINPKLIFKLQLHPQGYLPEEELERMGLGMLAKDAKRVIVVFPNEESLGELRRRLGAYARAEQYPGLAVIEAISEIAPEDRIGTRLKAEPLLADEIVALDIELWHGGNRQEARQRVNEIESFLKQQKLTVTDWWIGENFCLLRAKITVSVLPTLLGIDYVKEIERRPSPSFEMLEVAKLDVSQLTIETNVPDDLIGVLILDSGVMQQHPLIGPALGDAQVFPDRLRERITESEADGDEKTGGHGTAVGGIAIYHDIGECIATRTFSPSAQLFSARVTDNNNEYDEDELLEHQLETAINYFLGNYPTVRVVNISLGDQKLIYSDGSYQFRLAAAIDELAYKHRDREVVFVISAGNFFPTEMEDEAVLHEYPAYLLDSDEARVISPATAALAITVGGLSYGPGRDRNQYYDRGTERLVAGERGWPSPFTRIGPGFDGAIKPEVVDYAGDLKFERGRILTNQLPDYAGVPTTAKNFAPPDGRLFRTVAGTIAFKKMFFRVDRSPSQAASASSAGKPHSARIS